MAWILCVFLCRSCDVLPLLLLCLVCYRYWQSDKVPQTTPSLYYSCNSSCAVKLHIGQLLSLHLLTDDVIIRTVLKIQEGGYCSHRWA